MRNRKTQITISDVIRRSIAMVLVGGSMNLLSVLQSDSATAASTAFAATHAHRTLAYDATKGLTSTLVATPLVSSRCSNLVPYANLEGCDLSGQNLNSVDLHGANLNSTNLNNTSFENANLERATFTHAYALTPSFVPRVNFKKANLVGANLSDTQFDDANYTGADMRLVHLERSSNNYSVFRNANLGEAVLDAGWYAASDFNGANLYGASITGAYFSSRSQCVTGANWYHCVDPDAFFTGVKSGGMTGEGAWMPSGWQLVHGFLIDASGKFKPGTDTQVPSVTPDASSLIYDEADNKYFLLVRESLTWQDALLRAATYSYRGQQGYLAVPATAEADAAITQARSGEGAWQGAISFDFPNGVPGTNGSTIYRRWTWASGPLAGTTVNECANAGGGGYSGCTSVLSAPYTNWSSGQPDNFSADGGQWALNPWGPYNWDDQNGNYRIYFVVEFDGATSVVPDAPTVNLPTKSTSGQLTWTWSPNADGGSAITTYSWTGACSGSGNVVTITCSGLTGGTEYTLYVSATNTAGTSTAGSRSGTVPTPPSAPVFSASPANGVMNVTWITPSSNGGMAITGYTATATASGRSYSCTSTSLKCTITGLTNGTTYSLSVIATNAIGNSAPSNSVSIFPAPDTVFLAYSPRSVSLVKTNVPVLVANAKPEALVTVSAAGSTKTCTANAVGQCSVLLNSSKAGGWVIVASYVNGKKTVAAASSFRINLANITVSTVQVAKGKSFTVKMASGAPRTKFQVVTSSGFTYSVTLAGDGAGSITVPTTTRGPLTLTISDNGILLQTTTVAVV